MLYRRTPRWFRRTSKIIRSRAIAMTRRARCAAPTMRISTKSPLTITDTWRAPVPNPANERPVWAPACVRWRARPRTGRRFMANPENAEPLLLAEGVSKSFGRIVACRDVSFALYPGEVLAIVGESGSGKTTLLQMLSAQLAPSAGRVSYRMRDGVTRDLASLGEAERRFLFRTDWGYVHQDPAMGLRMAVSAGANVGERLMAVGWNHYGRIRDTASSWLERVEIDIGRIDDAPRTYSGGMRQRLQIARNLVTEPRLVFMDEPTGGLDFSVQAR